MQLYLDSFASDKVMASLQQRLSDSLTSSQTITTLAETFRGQEGSASRT